MEQKFVPQTVINPQPGGIQVIVSYAPQVGMVIDITIDQLKTALERVLQLRQQQSLLDKDAVAQMMTRTDLKVVK